MNALAEIDFDCVSAVAGLLLSEEGARPHMIAAFREVFPGLAEGVADATENRPLACVNRTANEVFVVRGLGDIALVLDWLVSGGRWLAGDDTTVLTPDHIPTAELASLNFVQLGADPAGADPQLDPEPVLQLITELLSRGVKIQGLGKLEEAVRTLAGRGEAARTKLELAEAALVGRLLSLAEGRHPAARCQRDQIKEVVAAHLKKVGARRVQR